MQFWIPDDCRWTGGVRGVVEEKSEVKDAADPLANVDDPLSDPLSTFAKEKVKETFSDPLQTFAEEKRQEPAQNSDLVGTGTLLAGIMLPAQYKRREKREHI